MLILYHLTFLIFHLLFSVSFLSSHSCFSHGNSSLALSPTSVSSSSFSPNYSHLVFPFQLFPLSLRPPHLFLWWRYTQLFPSPLLTPSSQFLFFSLSSLFFSYLPFRSLSLPPLLILFFNISHPFSFLSSSFLILPRIPILTLLKSPLFFYFSLVSSTSFLSPSFLILPRIPILTRFESPLFFYFALVSSSSSSSAIPSLAALRFTSLQTNAEDP